MIKKERLRICFVQSQLYPFFKKNQPTFGGSEAQFYLISQALSQKKEFMIYCLTGNYQQKKIEQYDRVFVCRGINPSTNVFIAFWQSLYFLYLLHQIKADVIIQRAANKATGLLALYSKIFRKKFIYMVACEADTDDRHQSLLGDRFSALIYRQGLKKSSLVICQTNQQQKNLQKNFQKESLVIRTPIYAIPPTYQQPSFSKVLWVGRNDPIKKPETFIRLAQQNPRLSFLMISPDTKYYQYSQRIKQAIQQTSNIEYLSCVPFEKIDDYFKSGLVLVNTSDFEGFPNTFVQAAKNGIPLLSLNVNPDNFIDRHHCGFFAQGDFTKLHQYLNQLANNRRLLQSFSLNAYLYAKKNHDLAPGIDHLATVISQLAAAKSTDQVFNFGENWLAYSQHCFNQQKMFEARSSLVELIGREKLAGRSFIDIGCGSGIFAIAAKNLGAKKTIGIDLSPQAIQAAKINCQKSDQTNLDFQVTDILDKGLDKKLGLFDIVYAWGSLHHTGHLWSAMENSLRLVAGKGLVVLAVYNRHWTSPSWEIIKKKFNYLPPLLQKPVIWFFFVLIYFLKFLLTLKNPLKKARGMNPYYDIVDWLGGYPYEYADADAVIRFCANRGFQLVRLKKTALPIGNNEFVFQKLT